MLVTLIILELVLIGTMLDVRIGRKVNVNLTDGTILTGRVKNGHLELEPSHLAL